MTLDPVKGLSWLVPDRLLALATVGAPHPCGPAGNWQLPLMTPEVPLSRIDGEQQSDSCPWLKTATDIPQ